MNKELCPTCIKRLLIAKQRGYGREKTKNLMCSLECARILEEQEKSGLSCYMCGKQIEEGDWFFQRDTNNYCRKCYDARSVAGKVVEKFRGEQ